MATIFSWIFKSSQQVYGIVFGALVICCYFFIGKNSKLKANNENLNTKLEEIDNDSKQIVDIQSKQTEIASRPSGSRDDIHKWMRDLPERPSRKR
jgi:hypothetical protein